MTEAEARALFLLAGWDVTRLHPLRNGYSESRTDPWWLVETRNGLIRIGWRKRVISIDWESTELRQVITDNDVTKDEQSVHAWGYAKALEYLTALRRAFERASALAVRNATDEEPSANV